MSLRFSILLIAIGAAVVFLVDRESQGVEIQTLGLIFLGGGIAGLVFSLAVRVIRGASSSRRRDEEPATAGEDRRESVLRDGR